MAAEADRFLVGDIECLRAASTATSLELERVPAGFQRQLDSLMPLDGADAPAVERDLEWPGMIEMRARIAGPFAALNGTPATVADPKVGAISVPSVLTVVVLPAPLGPRKPNTSP